MSFQVFLSHSSHNLCDAVEIRQAIEQSGVRCWMAPDDMTPGVSYATCILQGLRASQVVVTVLSAEANQSPHVKNEVERGCNWRKVLLTVRVEDVVPENDLEYFLSRLHWFDAFPPPRGPRLAQLVAAVKFHQAEFLKQRERQPYEPQPAEQVNTTLVPVVDIPNDPQVTSEAWTRAWAALIAANPVRQVVRRLAEAMIQQAQSAVRLDLLDPDQQQVALALWGRGMLHVQNAGGAQGVQLVSFAGRQLCQLALADWVAAQGHELPHDLTASIERFPQLADGVAAFIGRHWPEAGRTLFVRLIDGQAALLERVTSGVVAELGRHASEREQLLALALPRANLAILRGLAHGAQRLMKMRAWDPTEAVYRALVEWQYPARSRDAAQRSRLLAEIANEQGRLLRRLRRLDEAVAQFHRTVELAERLGDECLAGIATNNLAGTLLELPDNASTRRREAVALLERNITRLTRCHEQRHLAVAYHQLGQALRGVDAQRAEAAFRSDVEICRQQDEALTLADALDTLGSFLTDQGRFLEAEQTHLEELDPLKRAFDLGRLARGLANLGRACFRQGLLGDAEALRRACTCLEKSCRHFSSLDTPEDYAPALENLGRAYWLSGETAKGRQRLEEALAQYRLFPGGERIAREIADELTQVELPAWVSNRSG